MSSIAMSEAVKVARRRVVVHIVLLEPRRSLLDRLTVSAILVSLAHIDKGGGEAVVLGALSRDARTGLLVLGVVDRAIDK
eukprot:7003564-Prymnesium_polylepis.1